MSVQRKSSPSPTSPAAESDLETTAELPVLDVAAYEAATTEERLGNTDTWIIQSPTARESQELPTPRENSGVVADAASVASAAPPSVVPTPHHDRRTHDEKRAHLEVSLHALSDNLREVEERLKRKGERLSEIEKALAHANAERAVAEQRSQQLTAELAHARAAIAAAELRATELQRGLEERDTTNAALRANDREFEEK